MLQLKTDKQYIIGVDEVGVGCIAGKLYVCAFLAPTNWSHKGITDSKKLTSKTRERLVDELFEEGHKTCEIQFNTVSVHPNDVDTYKEYGTNLHGALKYLYWKAVDLLLIGFNGEPLIVLDGNIPFPEHPRKLGESISLPKADALVQHVGAASILAKAARDAYMTELDVKYPNYGWMKNKGYPTSDHLAALKKHGYCDEHRKSFEPIKSML